MGMQERLHYIDWLRVLAFMTLIVFHCAIPFVEGYNWEINNTKESPGITRVVWWVHQWRLPLLFFISGVGVHFSLRKRSVAAFFGERFVRLFIPLVFAIFFITPIQVYFEWLQKGRIHMSYADFYPSVYDIVPYPDGAFTWSHMWFVAYLFVFTILLLPVFSLTKLKGLQRVTPYLDTVLNKPIVVLFLALPFVGYFFWLYIDWPEQGSLIDDWFVFISSLTFYLFGFVCSRVSSFWTTCLKYRKRFLILALFLATVLIWQFYWDWEASKPKVQDTSLYVYGVLNAFHIWSIILAAIGYTMKYLNFSNTTLSYLNTAVYPFFILHQAVIVASGYYILQWEMGIAVKLFALVGVCIGTIWLLYHFLIRKTIVTRVLFGMRWNQKRSAKTVPVP